MRLPLFFRKSFTLSADGDEGAVFFVRISIDGRCLRCEEDASELGRRFWIFGVNPGGVSGSGDTEEEAQRDFFDGIHDVLLEFARESNSPTHLAELVAAFVSQTNEPELEDWNSARAWVRANGLAVGGLERITEERQPSSEVEVYLNEKKKPGTLESIFQYEALVSSNEELSLAAVA